MRFSFMEMSWEMRCSMEAGQENFQRQVLLYPMLWKRLKNLNRNVMTMWKEEKLRLEDKSSMKRRFFIRMKGNVEEKIEDIRYSFGDVEIVKVDGLDGEFGFVTPIMMEGDYDTRAKSYEDQILGI